MKTLILSLTTVLVIVVVAAAHSETETAIQSSTMMSRFKIGQQVRVLESGGWFNIEIPNDLYIKSFERKNNNRKYVTSKITEIGSDFIVVTSANGGEKAIAFHAIDAITKLPQIKLEADDDAKK